MLFCLSQIRITTASATYNSVTLHFSCYISKVLPVFTESETIDPNMTQDCSSGVRRIEGKAQNTDSWVVPWLLLST